MNVRYIVGLLDTDRDELLALTRGGRCGARKLKRAQILLAADRGVTDEEVARATGVAVSTVYRTKQKYVLGGVDHALNEKQRSGGQRKLSAKDEAKLIALACSDPPQGRARWTLELLAAELVGLVEVESVSRETVRRRLGESDLKPWRQKMWCIPKVDAEFVARMEDILDLYAEPADPLRPVVSFDETPVQLLGETRVPVAMKPGRPRRFDYEYRRNGTANLFVLLDAHRRWRHVEVTDRRTKADFAQRMKDLVDVHYPGAAEIRVVLDNLSTHTAAALYETFPPAEARRVLRKLEFHFTPKHASWLNMVEIEIGVLSTQCLDHRIPDKEMLAREVAAWQRRRNDAGGTVRWMFTVDDARRKMGHAYP